MLKNIFKKFNKNEQYNEIVYDNVPIDIILKLRFSIKLIT